MQRLGPTGAITCMYRVKDSIAVCTPPLLRKKGGKEKEFNIQVERIE